ncbi:MAG: DNA polymerase III subunit alpha, partial [Flavobacteriaceae bacterium]|nr:DNA polymerase III subunit alpha [Flavobacteriaceae bacterium]
HGIELDPENFPLDDIKTYELFQRGETIGIFQYESPGMQKHMRSLKPTVFEDLIAMNALYRPGPMEYIPSFINRKHGTEEIEYDLPAMEEYLAETYGITVYQEQVMLLSQKLANFTKGEADILRKAMGKKQAAVLAKMKPKFIEQASKNGHDADKLEKIWKDWEAFASYAFNKSHSTCYAWIAYQTAYLKAHYPAEYMASVLSNNMNDIKQVSFFMEECKRMGLEVLGPDINESYLKFSVNAAGAVRFGMAAVKGVGNAAVRAIIKERKENGNYTSIFDLAKRVDLRAANKKSFDSLVKAGAFDSFSNTHRAQYFAEDEKGITFLERALKYGNKFQENENSAQVSLFGEASSVQFPEPEIPNCDTWGTMELLSQEKEVIGMYISAHPLDDFKNEMIFCNAILKDFKGDLKKIVGNNLSFAGIVTDVQHRVSKAGKGWASFTIEDYNDSNEFRIFGEEYLKFKHFLMPNAFLYIRATIKPGWVNKDGIEGEPRIKFTDFKLLHDIMDELCKKLTIKLPIQEVNEENILNLESILKNKVGKQNLRFTLWDAKEKIEVNLPSRNTKIHVSNELLATLQKQQIDFKLN